MRRQEYRGNTRVAQAMRDVPIQRIMTTDPSTVGPDDPASAAESLLGSGDIHHLPVVEDNKVVGIVSSADLLKTHLFDKESESLNDVTVSQIMTTNPVVLDSRANLRDAAKKLSNGGFHALPIVDPDQVLVGIVTSSDLIDHLLHQIPTGDGSIETRTPADSTREPDDNEITDALREAEKSVDRGEEYAKLAQLLVHMRKRNRLLQDACKAAELYVRSGHGEHEHAVLVKRLSDLQARVRRTDL